MKTKIYFIDGTDLTIDVDFRIVYGDIAIFSGFIKFGKLAINISSIKYIEEVN